MYVSETLIRNQIIIGVSDEDFRKNALKEEWTLQQLEDHERRTEAAAIGAAALTDNSHVKISKIAGKYSKKYRNKENLHASKKDNQSESHTKGSFVCFSWGRHRYNQDYCPAKKSICHLCKGNGQWAGLIVCSGTSEKSDLKSKNKHSKDRALTRYVDPASTSTDESPESSHIKIWTALPSAWPGRDSSRLWVTSISPIPHSRTSGQCDYWS